MTFPEAFPSRICLVMVVKRRQQAHKSKRKDPWPHLSGFLNPPTDAGLAWEPGYIPVTWLLTYHGIQRLVSGPMSYDILQPIRVQAQGPPVLEDGASYPEVLRVVNGRVAVEEEMPGFICKCFKERENRQIGHSAGLWH